jgi:hypothetical protein
LFVLLSCSGEESIGWILMLEWEEAFAGGEIGQRIEIDLRPKKGKAFNGTKQRRNALRFAAKMLRRRAP